MCKTITIKEISEDTIYFSSGFSEWYAERLNNGQYELRHTNRVTPPFVIIKNRFTIFQLSLS